MKVIENLRAEAINEELEVGVKPDTHATADKVNAAIADKVLP